MQAQGTKQYVANQVVESILAAAAIGVALGVTIALAFSAMFEQNEAR
jgi:ABC-type lipoprotein release transport system permease subunit